jgi:hypothetical protein
VAGADGSLAPRPFLGVARSLSGKYWRERLADLALVESHRRKLQLPEVAARLLAARGVTAQDAAGFLDPTLRRFFPDPSTFADMDKAAAILEDAIIDGRKVAVFADYDVDGGTSAALLVRYFRARGRELALVFVGLGIAIDQRVPHVLRDDHADAHVVEIGVHVLRHLVVGEPDRVVLLGGERRGGNGKGSNRGNDMSQHGQPLRR